MNFYRLLQKQKYINIGVLLSILIAFYPIEVLANSSQIWRYDISKFIGLNMIKLKKDKIKSVTVQKKSWNSKEKRLSLVVKTDTKIYKDDFIFCIGKEDYHYCGIEDDGGYIKIDNSMNIQMHVTFTSSNETGVVAEFAIDQKERDKWISPKSKL